MNSEYLTWSNGDWAGLPSDPAQTSLVIYFGSRELLADGKAFVALRSIFSTAQLVGCSTGGQIKGDEVSDHVISALAISFASTGVRIAKATIEASSQSLACGQALGAELAAADLAAVFVLSDGLKVNGSDLAAGIIKSVGNHIPVSGGLAGDGAKFVETLVGVNEAPRPGVIGAVGLYGKSIRIGTGSAGGWDVFGPRRRITKSRGNVLLTLDDQPALDLYEKYLGPEESKALPGSGLLFPLRISDPARPGHDVVRTILAIDRVERSMTFAGDMPEGWGAQLMRGHHDRLTAGAAAAAQSAQDDLGSAGQNGVALLVSCIGRRLLMGQRVNDEVEAVGAELGETMKRIGFYSYGELSPHEESGFCELHNQTMTVTTISEAA